MFICSKLRQNLSKIQDRTLERIQKAIWDHLPAFKAEIIQKQQSWTKVLTHLSKRNAFYRRPSVTSKSIFFIDRQPPPLSPFSMLQYTPWTLSPGYNIEMGRGGRNVKLDIENSLVKRNGSFSESVSTTFVYDCLNWHILKLSQYHHCSVYSEILSIIV